MTQPMITVIGAGLAGSEAAWQLAERGIKVTLYEMRPHVTSPAHHTDGFAELVTKFETQNGLEPGSVLKTERDLAALIEKAIYPAAPLTIREGGIIRQVNDNSNRDLLKNIKVVVY